MSITPKEQLQVLLDKYPAFKWTGRLGRKRSGEDHFMLGAFQRLDEATRASKYAQDVFRIQADPRTLAYELRTWLLGRIGAVVVYAKSSVPPKGMIDDVRALDEMVGTDDSDENE